MERSTGKIEKAEDKPKHFVSFNRIKYSDKFRGLFRVPAGRSTNRLRETFIIINGFFSFTICAAFANKIWVQALISACQ